jgi:hypothetical protein
VRPIPFALSLVSLVWLTSAAPSALATPAWRPLLDGPGDAPGGGDLSVTVSARAERSELGAGASGFVALAVPLDRLAAPKKLGTNGVDPPPDASPPSRPDVTPEGDAAPVDEEGGVEPALSAALLARLARDAVVAALRAHAMPRRRSELEGLASRTRWSATLPELRLRVLRSNDESLRLTPTLEDPERYTHDGGNDFLMEASATWKLNRLVFADEEIAIERLELEREKSVERLSEHVVERLFDWHRALSELAAPDAGARRRGLLELERLEAEVELDVLTGGWFGDVARRFVKPRPEQSDYKRDDSTSSSRASSSSTRTLPTPSQ